VLAIVSAYSPKFPETVRADFRDRYGIVRRLGRLNDTTQIPCRWKNGRKPHVEREGFKKL
jgi:hypothetical protein